MFIEYRGKTPRVAASAFVAPTAVLVGDVIVGEQASIWFGVVVRADHGTVRIGARTAIEDNAVIHATHDRTTVLGNDVVVGHGAVLDDCTVEEGAFVGSNATILEGATVGKHSLVAAGSVVSADDRIPDGVVAAGSPAIVRKDVAGRPADVMAHAARESLEEAHAYRRDNIGDPAHHDVRSTSRKKANTVVAPAR
ncbi:MAG: gamma carbonic anhydrase family protein [Vulcanimicrobiaceae bacterium]